MSAHSIDMVGGEVKASIAGDHVALKVVRYNGDAVELDVTEVRRLVEALLALADAIDAHQSKVP
ncbi:MAG TPA: hypothetical protein VFQ53_42070 [Kofleriaceae bacterium]|nr:hypothetical protein [Kofleriaceae bacterium]